MTVMNLVQVSKMIAHYSTRQPDTLLLLDNLSFIPEDESDKQPAHKRQRGLQIREQCNYHRSDPQIAFCLDCIKYDLL